MGYLDKWDFFLNRINICKHITNCARTHRPRGDNRSGFSIENYVCMAVDGRATPFENIPSKIVFAHMIFKTYINLLKHNF